MTSLAVAAGAVSQARRYGPAPSSPPAPTTTTNRSSYPTSNTGDHSSSTLRPPHHERARNGRPRSTPTTRTSITALPTIGTCLHKLPYLSPQDAQPLIAHNSSPRSDEGLRESMLFDALATTQRARRSSHPSTTGAPAVFIGSPPAPVPEWYPGTEPPPTGCVACNNAIASSAHAQRHLRLPVSSHAAPSVHAVAPSPPRSPAPSASSSSRSRPSSIASNSSRKIFSLTPLDVPSPSVDHDNKTTAEDSYFSARRHYNSDARSRSPAFASCSHENSSVSSSPSSSESSDSDSDSDSEDDEMRRGTRTRRSSAYSAYSSDGSGGGGRAGRMVLMMSKMPPPSQGAKS